MNELLRALGRHPIELFPERAVITTCELRDGFPQRPIVACDFHVPQIHEGDTVVGGYARDGVLNIDHHAPTERMAWQVSSANLALAHVRELGPVSAETVVVVNHTDCDSVLSSGIMRGILPPDPVFGEAAIAADHTGAEHDIPDLLQTISDRRDLSFSLSNLERLLAGRPLDPAAMELLRRRQADREALRELVRRGSFRRAGSIAYAELQEKVDGGLLPSLLPDAAILMIAASAKTNPRRWEMRVRLGLGAPPGVSLLKLGITEFDPNFGGARTRARTPGVGHRYLPRRIRAATGRTLAALPCHLVLIADAAWTAERPRSG